MELNELKALMAASLLGGKTQTVQHDPLAIRLAVKAAQLIWLEVLKQERE
jgi:hypothetical protein